MRNIQITDAKTIELLNSKNEFVMENQNILKQMEELEVQFNKNIGTVKRTDEKARVKLKKHIPELGEYEQVSRVYTDNGEWFFEIADRMEEFKNNFKK